MATEVLLTTTLYDKEDAAVTTLRDKARIALAFVQRLRKYGPRGFAALVQDETDYQGMLLAYEENVPKEDWPSKWWFRRRATRETLRWLVKQATCDVRGHELKCEGFCGPDSGREEFECTRCGWSETVRYY